MMVCIGGAVVFTDARHAAASQPGCQLKENSAAFHYF